MEIPYQVWNCHPILREDPATWLKVAQAVRFA